MNTYLVFPVKVDGKEMKVTSRKEPAGYTVTAENYELAHQQGANHVPLFEGEQLAVVLIGKAK